MAGDLVTASDIADVTEGDIRMVVLLCGPPGAGKTTAAHTSGLEVFDRDDPKWSGEKQFVARIGDLARQGDARAVVIRAGASSSARAKAARLIGASHVFLLLAERQELAHRVARRGRADVRNGLASIKSWFEDFDRDDGVQVFPGWDLISGSGLSLGVGSRAW